MAILRDGLIGTQHYPDATPVLEPTPRKLTNQPQADYDRTKYVLEIRPRLVLAGNLTMTDDMRKEEAAVRKQLAREGPKAIAAPAIPDAQVIGIRLANGDYVPVGWKAEGEVDPEPLPLPVAELPEIKNSGCPF